MMPEAKTYSPEQIRFQQLFNVRTAESGVVETVANRGVRKALANAATLGVGLAADLLESHAVIHFKNATFEKQIHKLARDKGADASETKVMKGLLGGFEFAEEYMSDKAYSDVMNAWLRYKTGVDTATYASEASAFISEWTNAIVQVFLKNRTFGLHMKEGGRVQVHEETGKPIPKTALNGWIILAHPMENFINPVTVEAASRLLEQVPAVGSVVTWGKEKLNHALEHSKELRYINAVAAKAVTGYHIMRNIAK